MQPAARTVGSVFDGVMGLFSRKRREAFDLAELGLPRVVPGAPDRPAGEHGVVMRLSSCDELARTMAQLGLPLRLVTPRLARARREVTSARHGAKDSVSFAWSMPPLRAA